jgi:hypothetical protein
MPFPEFGRDRGTGDPPVCRMCHIAVGGKRPGWIHEPKCGALNEMDMAAMSENLCDLLIRGY